MNINLYKKKLFLNIINFIKDHISFNELWNAYKEFLNNLNVTFEEIEKISKKKDVIRGSFLKKIFLEYILIPREQEIIINKYFYSTNNIYNGQIIINNEIYYKFFTFKIIRDNLESPTFLITENSIEDNYEKLFKINHNKTQTIIGKIKYLNNQKQYMEVLKCKLIEEGNEVMNSKQNTLFEEIGDVYSILNILKVFYK
jgi:hypothetical protein